MPRLVPAPCLRRACAIGRTARTPPPLPLLLHPPTKRAMTARRQRGDMGGGGEKKKNKQQRTPTRQSRGRQQGQTGHGGGQGARQGARDGGTPLGTKARRQGQTPQRTGGSRADKSPRKTLVRYPTSGVWGPPRCPYRPHLSAGNKVGYARDRWPAARGGTGLGGVANGPDQEHSPRHVLRFVSCEGLRVGHTVHPGRQETRLSRKDSPETHSVPDPGVGKGQRTWLRRRSICTERVQMDGPYNRVTP